MMQGLLEDLPRNFTARNALIFACSSVSPDARHELSGALGVYIDCLEPDALPPQGLRYDLIVAPPQYIHEASDPVAELRRLRSLLRANGVAVLACDALI